MSLEAETHFSLELLRQTKVDESVVISPISVALAFAMIHAGAGGKSEEEIRNVIAKGASTEQVMKYYKSVSEALLKKGDAVVKLANRIFIAKSYKLKQSYLDKIKENFGAKAINLDFNDGKKCSKIVNDFVDEVTAGKIKDMVQPNAFRDAIFVLINAIYFEGEWGCPFDSGFEKDFHVTNKHTKKIVFMKLRDVGHPYIETDEVQMFSKSYKDPNFKFIVILPKQKFGLADVRKNLTAEKLLDLTNRMHSHQLTITMPKFKIETTTPLVDVLKTLGIKEVFSSSADLSGIAGGVHISSARQKAFIEVDEMGTKAAAATECFGHNVKACYAINFFADHPFLYFLTHKKSIVFCGQFNG